MNVNLVHFGLKFSFMENFQLNLSNQVKLSEYTNTNKSDGEYELFEHLGRKSKYRKVSKVPNVNTRDFSSEEELNLGIHTFNKYTSHSSKDLDNDTLSDSSSNISFKEHPNLSKNKIIDVTPFEIDNVADYDSLKLQDEHGIKIDSFNLKEEREMGNFDKEGNYIETTNKKEQDQDQWLNEFENKEVIQKTVIAKEKMECVRKNKLKEKKHLYMLDDALIRISYFISKNETITNTLGRFNEYRNKYIHTIKKLKGDKLHDEISSYKTQLRYLINGINLLTELISILEQKGIPNVYDLTRTMINILIKEESLSNKTIDNYATKQWAFKWLHSLNEPQQSYTNYEMQSWKQNYFESNVIVKMTEDDDKFENWIHIKCLEFMESE